MGRPPSRAGPAGGGGAAPRRGVPAPAPRLGAVVEVLTLAAIGLAPPLLLACAAAAAGTWSGGRGHMVAGVCVLAAGPARPAPLAPYGLARAPLAPPRPVAGPGGPAGPPGRARGPGLAGP